MLLVAILLNFAGAAFAEAPLGGENIDITGNIEMERESQGALLNFFSGATKAAVTGNPVIIMGVAYGQMFTNEAYVPPWEYYPISRYQIDNYDENSSFISKMFHPLATGQAAAASFFANLIFNINKFLAYAGIQILNYAFHSDWAATLSENMAKPLTQMWAGGDNVKGVKEQFMPAIMLLVFVYMIFKLIQKNLSDIIRAFIATIAITALTIVFFANVSPILKTINSIVDDASSAALTAVSPLYDPGDPRLAEKVKEPKDKIIAGFMNTAWRTLVVGPWALAEFGTVRTDRLTLTPSEYTALNQKDFDFNGTNNFGEIQVGKRLDTLLLGLSSNSKGRQAVVQALGDPSKRHNANTPSTLSPGNLIQNIIVVFCSLISTAVFFVLATVCGGTMILSQLSLSILLMFLIFVALGALIPESGWNFGITYIKWILGAFFTKFFYGSFLSVVMIASEAAQRIF